MKWQQISRAKEAKVLCSPGKVKHLIDGDFFSNILELIAIACTLPVTSCECERSISRVGHLKTYLRNTTGEERLNGLVMMYIHKDIPCDSDVIVEQFTRRHPRRLKLLDPLCDDW